MTITILLKNIPISISLLHEQEYDNLCLILKPYNIKNRRTFSERSTNSFDRYIHNRLYVSRRKTLKN